MYKRHFGSLGKEVTWNTASNYLEIPDMPLHIHGHGYYEDNRAFINALSAQNIEAMHIPNWQAFNDMRELVKSCGKKMSISKPSNFAELEPVEDPENGGFKINKRGQLDEKRFLIKIRRKFGQMWGGVIEMMSHTLVRRGESNIAAGIDVRTDLEGNYNTYVADTLSGGFHHANDPHSSRGQLAGPSAADMTIPSSRKGVSPLKALKMRLAA
jgi:hypothetical protein